MQETISYLINFLAGSSDTDYTAIVGYTANQEEFSKYKIVIIPSTFFDSNSYGKHSSIPTLPLQEINNIPLLFGSPKVEKIKDTLVVHADIIASAYFLLTRYEEWIRTDCRDIHGRFPGKESIPSRAGFIHRPIVDEYGKLLQSWLTEYGISVTEKKPQTSKIYLTHDVDQASKHRSVKGFLRALTTGENPFKSFFGKIENDPLFTFPWIFKENKNLKEALKDTEVESIFFFKSLSDYLPEDKPYYDLYSKDIQLLLQQCEANKVQIGLHTSYLSGDNLDKISVEKKQLEQAIGHNIAYNRHHYLRSKEPMDMETLLHAGITDDFTMGYADVAGFRLGTCKAVKWINLQTKEISSLVLHPLTVMDRSLSEERYMHLNYGDALTYCKALVDKTRKFNGELVLLWHNTELIESNKFPHKNLYKEVLAYINTSHG
jgi:hypothetical protein